MPVPTCRVSGLVRILAAVSVLVSCSDQREFPHLTEPSFAKRPASPSVTSATPAYAYQGTANLNVTITGSGFDKGTKASWYLNGAPYPKITVNSTSYVSSSQLVANITIAGDAQIDQYDIVVTSSTTKQGIGSDCFVVTLAVPIPVVGRGINRAGQVVGELANSNTFTGNLWDPGVGMVPLPNAYRVWAIDESGSLIVGKDNAGAPAYWTSSAGASGPWTEAALPLPAGLTTASARSLAADATGTTVLVAGAVVAATGHRPAVWTRTTSGWDVSIDSLPTGVPSGWAESINARGQRAGMDGTAGAYALYWDSLGTARVLSANRASAWSINGDGTIVVGSANGVAAMWTRTLVNGVYGPWSGDILLDTPANSCTSPNSTAYAINAAGTVAVGASCGQPVAWNIAGTTVDRFLIGTLGPPNSGSAFAINNLDLPNAAGGGGQSGSGFATGVLWKSF